MTSPHAAGKLLTLWAMVVAAAAAMAAAPTRVIAQRFTPPVFAEYRADAIVGRGTSAEGGVGVVVPLGVYVRFNVDGAAGANWREGTTNATGRVDAIGRFLLDPYRESPIGFSLGGGVSVPVTEREARTRPYLTGVVDIEGRMRGRVTPALQIGLGGGTRIGIVLRTSPSRWR